MFTFISAFLIGLPWACIEAAFHPRFQWFLTDLLQPTPPPKNTPSRSFGLAQKASFSFISMRQNSGGGLLRSTRPSESTLDIPDTKRRSQDDSESSRGLVYSSSSIHSGDHRMPKGMNFLSKLKTRSSKTHLRSDSDGSEHPSLKPPVPPLPQQRHPNGLLIPAPSNASASTLSIPGPKKSKGKKRAIVGSSKVPPTPPPKDDDEQQFTGDLNLDSMEGILDPKIVSAASGSSPYHNGLGRDPSSPSSGFDSGQSHSDHSFLHPSEFIDPFTSTPIHEKRKGVFPGDYRRLSPKTIIPPPPDSYRYNGTENASSTTLGPGSPTWPQETWKPPESWAVKGTDDDNFGSARHDSDTDASVTNVAPSIQSRRGTLDKGKSSRRARNPASSSFSSVASTTSRASRSTVRGSQQSQLYSFKMRVPKPHGTAFHLVSTELTTTVAELILKMSKSLVNDDNLTHNMYLKEQGRGMLVPEIIIKL